MAGWDADPAVHSLTAGSRPSYEPTPRAVQGARRCPGGQGDGDVLRPRPIRVPRAEADRESIRPGRLARGRPRDSAADSRRQLARFDAPQPRANSAARANTPTTAAFHKTLQQICRPPESSGGWQFVYSRAIDRPEYRRSPRKRPTHGFRREFPRGFCSPSIRTRSFRAPPTSLPLSPERPSDGLFHKSENGAKAHVRPVVGCPTSVGRVGLEPTTQGL